jgi:hypothetical protein
MNLAPGGGTSARHGARCWQTTTGCDLPFLLTAALIGAGAYAVNVFLSSRAAANGGVESSIGGYPLRSIGILAGIAIPLLIGGPLGLLAAAIGVGSAWPLIMPQWGSAPPQIPGSQPPPGLPPGY